MATSPTITHDTPVQLVALAEPACFEELYRHEYHSVVALAYALTGRGAVAEELAQEAFITAHRNWQRVSTYASPGAFVRRVVANMAFSTRRRWAAEARALARVAARTPRWEAAVADDDTEFWRCVRALPRRQAQALALRYLEDRSDADIAGILGCSEPTVRAHLHNGRLALARRLGPGRTGQHRRAGPTNEKPTQEGPGHEEPTNGEATTEEPRHTREEASQ